ncbi:unnamed protein product [Schistosoma curassoni]|uniref:Uncharacterized protein n=1 Tax=Schistosoma curassoni TaxID=6186 RepID=A0A183KQF7_9TREM|nr:unnamed protein product [Schistosoma curassoni]
MMNLDDMKKKQYYAEKLPLLLNRYHCHCHLMHYPLDLQYPDWKYL